ncbi:NEL-type E3 ubiquitin ligase domain-containing protein [Sodalis glossinidius]|uniref:NEL-type E3 ubiquitin ligase domain-containing protein n=1 Tax=Sodalis glossinidius TaxID=63612 RepID=UPI0003240E06|nr:NEL-type E3 ubiquitin ligase domain-containing protein [Sodalis glossinidius]
MTAGLESLPQNALVNVTLNPLPIREVERLERRVNGVRYRGPRIIFSMPSSHSTLPPPALSICVAKWGQQSIERWQEIEAEPGASAFSLFLDRLSYSVNYGNTNFKNAVSAWLTKLADEENTVLRTMTFQISEEASQSCEDRVSLAYNEMKMLILTDEIEKGHYDERINELIALARGLFRLEILSDIAREKTNSLNFVDEIEVYLAYQIKLRAALSLPLDTVDMRFFNVSWVTEEDLANAKERVERTEKKEFFYYLSTEWQPWQAVLKRIAPTDYHQQHAKLQEAMNADFNRMLTLRLKAVGLIDDDDASRQLGIEVKRDIERDIMGQMTTAFLKRRGLEFK